MLEDLRIWFENQLAKADAGRLSAFDVVAAKPSDQYLDTSDNIRMGPILNEKLPQVVVIFPFMAMRGISNSEGL